MTSWTLLPKVSLADSADGAYTEGTEDTDSGAYTEPVLDGAWTGVWVWTQIEKPSTDSSSRGMPETDTGERGASTDTSERGALVPIYGSFWSLYSKPTSVWSEVSVA